MKKIIAKNTLRNLAYTINQQLDNGMPTKNIYDVAAKKIEELKGNSYTKVDWS